LESDPIAGRSFRAPAHSGDQSPRRIDVATGGGVFSLAAANTGCFEMTADLNPPIELRHLTDAEMDAVIGGDKKGNEPLPKLPDDPIWIPVKILGGVLWWL